MDIKFAVFDKVFEQFRNGFYTVMDIAKSTTFPMDAEKHYEFVLVTGLVDEGNLPIIDGDVLELDGDQFTVTFDGKRWAGIPSAGNGIRGRLHADDFDMAFLIGNKRTDKVFIRGEV